MRNNLVASLAKRLYDAEIREYADEVGPSGTRLWGMVVRSLSDSDQDFLATMTDDQLQSFAFGDNCDHPVGEAITEAFGVAEAALFDDLCYDIAHYSEYPERREEEWWTWIFAHMPLYPAELDYLRNLTPAELKTFSNGEFPPDKPDFEARFNEALQLMHSLGENWRDVA